MSNNFRGVRRRSCGKPSCAACWGSSRPFSACSWRHLLGCRVVELVLRCPCEAGLRPAVAPHLFDEFNQFRRHVAILQRCCHGTQLPFIFLKRNFSKYCGSALCPSTSLKMCLVCNELAGAKFLIFTDFSRELYSPVHVNILLQPHFPLVRGKVRLKLWYTEFSSFCCFVLFVQGLSFILP